MQIEATNSAMPLPGPERRLITTSTERQDAATFTESDALAQKLSQTPAARPDAVARARSLIEQPEYPPDSVIRGISHLIASEISRAGE